MIQRIFHPIGQGAFYSERHEINNETFNIVYDCGTEKNNISKPYYDKVVKNSFSNDEIIHILFISHFDFDHVSKIEVLRESVKEIRYVVLSLLHNNEKILISNIYRNLGLDISPLINDPDKFFENSRVIYVKSSDDSNFESNNSPLDVENISQDKDGKYRIDSETRLTLGGLRNWIFIPYNHEYKSRNTELLKLLKAAGFDCEKLQNDTQYTLDEITKDLKLNKGKCKGEFKNIYNKLAGKINQNSMMVYSGPFQKDVYSLRSWPYVNYHYPFYFQYLRDIRNRVACIFTGDANINISSIQTIYSNLWQYVGTIQIPHHGDMKSFNEAEISDRNYFCPISFGKNNTYHHPSGLVIMYIMINNSLPVFVSDDPSSQFVQEII